MFHPLAYTKTFALIGVAILSITLVPALIPIFLKGRIKSEDENWLVRTMIEIFKPMLVVADGPADAGLLAVRRHPRAGLRRLDEAGPRVHARPRRAERSWTCRPPCPAPRSPRRRDDLRVRDEVLRGFPEVWQVVGKAGRAETPTDPSPLDMIETIINLRDRDALAQAEAPVRGRRGPDAGRARRPGGQGPAPTARPRPTSARASSTRRR